MYSAVEYSVYSAVEYSVCTQLGSIVYVLSCGG